MDHATESGEGLVCDHDAAVRVAPDDLSAVTAAKRAFRAVRHESRSAGGAKRFHAYSINPREFAPRRRPATDRRQSSATRGATVSLRIAEREYSASTLRDLPWSVVPAVLNVGIEAPRT
jgi:hypothetical protein